jgi:hypothetical protein
MSGLRKQRRSRTSKPLWERHYNGQILLVEASVLRTNSKLQRNPAPFSPARQKGWE